LRGSWAGYCGRVGRKIWRKREVGRGEVKGGEKRNTVAVNPATF